MDEEIKSEITSIKIDFTDENIKIKNHFAVEDTRFLNVEIYLMHLGENLNGSYFSKDVVDKAIPTLANTPILGYLEDGDYSNHRVELETEDEKYVWSYKGSAYGIIPETNNARYVERADEDGVVRTYLVVDGIMWTKWKEPIDILKKSGFKSQSMELHEEYKGEFGEDKLFHFTDISFFGACLLGENVTPAMTGSTVEVSFETGLKEEITNRLASYYSHFEQNDVIVTNEVDNKILNKKDNENDSEELIINETIEQMGRSEFMELSIEQIKDNIWESLNPRDEDGQRMWCAWIVATYPENKEVIVNYNNVGTSIYKKHIYEVSEENVVTLNEGVEIFAEFLTMEEVIAVNEMRLSLDAVNIELVELREKFELQETTVTTLTSEKDKLVLSKEVVDNEFATMKEDYDVIKPEFEKIQAVREKEEKQLVIDSFKLLNDEDKADVMANIETYSKEEIKSNLGDKLSAKQDEIILAMSKDGSDESAVIALATFSKKPTNRKDTEPEWAELFEDED